MKKILIALFIAIILFSCKREFLDTKPYDSISSASMWTSDNLTNLGVAGVYAALRLGIETGNPSGLELYQFDRFSFIGQGRSSDPLMVGTITPTSSLFSDTWQNYYEGIQRANDAIVNIPLKSPSDENKKARYVAECKFLRAYFYFKLNQLFKGVPVYLEPIGVNDAVKGRETEDKVWDVVINDLTDCINEPNLPLKYAKGDGNYGHVTKGAAYALRGKAYMYKKEWALAVADFESVQGAGYSLFPDYTALFKEANEQCDEMIFSIQHIGLAGYGSTMQHFLGSRSSTGSNWNNYMVSPNLVDLYSNKDGSKFNWDAVIPGYTAMPAEKREVFFLRNNLTSTEITTFTNKGLDMSLYLPNGNEQRIRQAYTNRDPRLESIVITPYASFNGVLGGAELPFISRWPYRTNNPPSYDLRTDTQTFFYYLYRKFVFEGLTETPNRDYGPTDFPLIRYADVLLMWAEAINEQGYNQQAIDLVNQVRTRAGVALLQTTNSTLDTYVNDQNTLREKIRDERRMEFPAEGISFFDELRWETWKDKVFYPGNGSKQIWGSNVVTYSYAGDYIYNWAVPLSEIQRNPNLVQNPGWPN